MTTNFPTAPRAYGLNGPSAPLTVEKSPHASHTEILTPPAARLFAVIDTLDAMTFDRPYRKALPFNVAKAEIVRMEGTQFDPKVVQTFLKEEEALREMAAMEYSSGSLATTRPTTGE